MTKVKYLNTLDVYDNFETPSKLQSVNYVNGDFNPNHKEDYRRGIAATAMEVNDDIADDNLPLMDVHDFAANKTFTQSNNPNKVETEDTSEQR